MFRPSAAFIRNYLEQGSIKASKREGMMMTMDYFNGKVDTTSTHSDKPWIHVRAALIKKLWMGLALFSTGGAWTAPPDGQTPFANAASA